MHHIPYSPDLPAIAREIMHAQDHCQTVEPFTSRIDGFDLAAGYAVGHLVHEARLAQGARAVGRKIGFSNANMWPQYGVGEPVWSYLYDTSVVHLSSTQAVCSLAQFAAPKIEPEIVVHFRATPPLGADLSTILNCVDWIAHGFEIVQCHYPNWKFQAPDTVADWALHATLLVGPHQPVANLGPEVLSALVAFSVGLSCEGDVLEVGTGANVLGSPIAAIAYLSGVLQKQPQDLPLQADELVTTGTLTAAYPVRPGQTWKTELSGIDLPGLTVDFSD